MFKYNYVADLFNRLVTNVDFPMQVELHPGPNCGPMHCRHCYGKQQRVNQGLLGIGEYARLLDELIGKTHLIDISGISTDPSSYPEICELISLLKERKYNFGLHTKGFALNEELCRLLNYGDTQGNFITASLDAATHDVYNLVHGAPKRSMVFDQVLERLALLKTMKMEANSRLRINVAYLLFKENSAEKHISRFIEVFEPIADVIRFSIPQVPNKAKPIGYLDKDEIRQVFTVLEQFEKDNVIVLKFDRSEHDLSFKYCWAQLFNITVDKAGNVFPCPQVATSAYNHLCYGNIRQQSIWEIWNSRKRKQILSKPVNEMKCRVCDRKDENINIELDKILDQDKYI